MPNSWMLHILMNKSYAAESLLPLIACFWFIDWLVDPWEWSRLGNSVFWVLPSQVIPHKARHSSNLERVSKIRECYKCHYILWEFFPSCYGYCKNIFSAFLLANSKKKILWSKSRWVSFLLTQGFSNHQVHVSSCKKFATLPPLFHYFTNNMRFVQLCLNYVTLFKVYAIF